jgi:hypothetical protein
MGMESLKRQIEARQDAGISVPGGSQMNRNIDPLARQTPLAVATFTPQELTSMAEGIWFCRHIAGVMSEDPIKNGFVVQFVKEDKERAKAVLQYLDERGGKDVLQFALWDDTVYGDGLIGLGIRAKGKGTADPTQPIKDITKEVKDIVYFDRIPRDDRFTDIVYDDDRQSPTYGQVKSYKVKISGDEMQMDASRAIHFQTRPRVKDKFGLSMFVPIWSVIQVVENTVWSLGQLAYNIATRVIHSDALSNDLAERTELMTDMEGKINTLSMLVVGNEENVSTVSNSPGSLKWFVDFVWDLAAAATRINRSRLLGAQAGALASAQSDLRRYYEFVSARQETYLRAQVRRLVQLALVTDDLAKRGSGLDDFTIVFNSVETPTHIEEMEADAKHAETGLKEAQAFQALTQAFTALVDLGVIDPESINTLLKATTEGEQGQSLMEKLFEEIA